MNKQEKVSISKKEIRKKKFDLGISLVGFIAIFIITYFLFEWYFKFKFQEFWSLSLKETVIKDKKFLIPIIFSYILICINLYSVLDIIDKIKDLRKKEKYKIVVENYSVLDRILLSFALNLVVTFAISLAGIVVGTVNGLRNGFVFVGPLTFFFNWGLFIGLYAGLVYGVYKLFGKPKQK
ncbi:MAG: hypothetical protein WCO35_01085 [Candidatus Nomurabacteria bacterium]